MYVSSYNIRDDIRDYILQASQKSIERIHNGHYRSEHMSNNYIRSNTHLLPSPQARKPVDNLEYRIQTSNKVMMPSPREFESKYGL